MSLSVGLRESVGRSPHANVNWQSSSNGFDRILKCGSLIFLWVFLIKKTSPHCTLFSSGDLNPPWTHPHVMDGSRQSWSWTFICCNQWFRCLFKLWSVRVNSYRLGFYEKIWTIDSNNGRSQSKLSLLIQNMDQRGAGSAMNIQMDYNLFSWSANALQYSQFTTTRKNTFSYYYF